MEHHGAPETTRLWAMVETPEAVLAVGEIASASPRLAVLVMGTNDLVKELGARHVPGREPLLTSLSLALLAARRSGVAILDGVHNDVTDLEGFAAECRQGRDLGFDGKTLIHPGQVGPCNEVFAPSAEEVEEARELARRLGRGRRCGRGDPPGENGREPPRRDRSHGDRDGRGDPETRLTPAASAAVRGRNESVTTGASTGAHRLASSLLVSLWVQPDDETEADRWVGAA